MHLSTQRSELGSLGKLLVAIGLSAALGACQSVEPWQRGTLANRAMALEVDPLEASLRDQVYFSKEASSGGRSAAGGGCGCN